MISNQSFDLEGKEYPFGFVSNFHFRMTTACDILRHYGVALAKSDDLAG